MASYSPATNFRRKDALPQGDPDKVICGAELQSEFTAIARAINSMIPGSYAPTTNFSGKDILASGASGKTILGAELDAEFDAIATAIESLGYALYAKTTDFAAKDDTNETIEGAELADEFAALRITIQACWEAGGGGSQGGEGGSHGGWTLPVFADNFAPADLGGYAGYFRGYVPDGVTGSYTFDPDDQIEFATRDVTLNELSTLSSIFLYLELGCDSSQESDAPPEISAVRIVDADGNIFVFNVVDSEQGAEGFTSVDGPRTNLGNGTDTAIRGYSWDLSETHPTFLFVAGDDYEVTLFQ